MRLLLYRLYGGAKTNRLAVIVLILTIVQMVIHLVPIFFHGGNTVHVGVSKDDVLDLFTPIMVIPLIWLLFAGIASDRPTTIQTILFLVASALWVEGHGIHLSSDSIGNMIGEDTATPGGSLVYFYDEVLGHHLWHVGMIAHSVLILWRGWFSKNATPMGSCIPFLIGGLWYGWLIFAFSVEGQTVPLGMGTSIGFVGAGVWRLYAKKSLGPAGVIFISASLLTLFLLVGWGIWHGGFPEFTTIEVP